MQRKLFFILVLFVFSTIIFAQRPKTRSVYLSAYAGDLAILSENFLDYYGSKNDFIFGVGLGIPISSTFSLDASATYFQKKSNLSEINQFDPKLTSNLEQIIFNAGVQIHLLPNKIIGLSFLLGASYSLIEEERKTENAVIVHKIEDDGNFGVYGGAVFELSLGKGPFAIFGDVKYTYSWEPILMYEDTYREIRYTGGLKIYLSKRWKKY